MALPPLRRMKFGLVKGELGCSRVVSELLNNWLRSPENAERYPRATEFLKEKLGFSVPRLAREGAVKSFTLAIILRTP